MIKHRCYVYAIWISLLLSIESNAKPDVEGVLSKRLPPKGSASLLRHSNVLKNETLRSMYTYDQDDLFLEFTTEVPSTSIAPSMSQVPSSSPSQSVQPTNFPSSSPTSPPTAKPTSKPSRAPSALPTSMPTSSPTQHPTAQPSSPPTDTPSAMPTPSPSSVPSVSPTSTPSATPSSQPTSKPTSPPTEYPTRQPSISPTDVPSTTPSIAPSSLPSASPTSSPSATPSSQPTSTPTSTPSQYPTRKPSISPSDVPSTMPSFAPTSLPSPSPTNSPIGPPSEFPSTLPTSIPTHQPSLRPSTVPTSTPSLTPTSSPSSSPTAHPNASPSSTPSMVPTSFPSDGPSGMPTSSPTRLPSKAPSESPSDLPTRSPSLSPTYSSQPTQFPTSTFAPSDKPSISQAPTVLDRKVELSMFFIEVISQDGISDVDGDLVVEIGESFLNGYLSSALPSKYNFVSLNLEKQSNLRRRLNVKSSTACTGAAHFNSLIYPRRNELDEYVIQAFKDQKKEFLTLLQNSDSPNLAQAINAGAKKNFPRAGSVDRGSTARTIVFVVCGVTIGGVALSFFAQQMIKRGMEKRINTHAFKYSKQSAEESEMGFAPMPLVISDDEDAVERSMIRLQHEREIMRRANERLQSSNAREPRRARKVVFKEGHVPIGYSVDEDETTITSIQFSSSGESTVSSLALNPVDPADPMDPIAEDAENADDTSDEMDSTERRMIEINAEASDIINKLSVGGFGGLMPCSDRDKESSEEAAAKLGGAASDIPREVYADSDAISSKNGNRSDRQRKSQLDHLPQTSHSQTQVSSSRGGGGQGSQGENSYFTNIFTRRY